MRAIVLSAGYGTRLGALTADWPKPMLDIGGVPLLERILRHLASQGVSEVGVNLHFRPEVIRHHFADGDALGVRIHYSEEPSLLGTAGGVRQFADWLREEAGPFVVQYGDMLTDQPLAPLLDRHRRLEALATILVHRRAGSNSVVDVDDEGRIMRFLERPKTAPADESVWVNSGLYVCDAALLDRIPEGVPLDLPRDIFPALVAEGRLAAVPVSGYRCAIDSPSRLEEARAAVAEGRIRVA